MEEEKRGHNGHEETIGSAFMGIYVQSNQITMCQLNKKEKVYVLNYLLLWSGLYLTLKCLLCCLSFPLDHVTNALNL